MKAPLKSLLSLLGGEAAMRAIGFVVTAYLARVLEPAAFGMISIGMAVLGYLQLLGSPGIQVVETRNIAASAHDLQSRAGAVISLRLLLAVVLLIGTWIVVTVGVTDVDMRAVILLHAASLVPMALFLDWVLQGKEKFAELSAARTAGYAAYALAAFVLVRAVADVRLAPTAFLVGNVVTALMLWLAVARGHFGVAVSWDPPAWRTILIENLPVGTALVLGQMVTNFPPLVVAGLLSTADTGVYTAAMKLVFLFLIFDRVLNAMMLPVVTRSVASRPGEAPRLITLTIKVVLLGALPLGLCGVVAAPSLVQLVFGHRYEFSVAVLQVLMGYVVLTLVNSVFVCVVLAGRKERAYLRAIALGTVALVVATPVLTSLLGLVGAAIGVVVGEAATVLLMGREAKAAISFNTLRSIANPLVGALGMATAAWLLRDADPLAALPISLAVFFVLVVITRTLQPDEIQYLRERIV
jgi:O-antigen/teichoic acid export membrane protein